MGKVDIEELKTLRTGSDEQRQHSDGVRPAPAE